MSTYGRPTVGGWTVGSGPSVCESPTAGGTDAPGSPMWIGTPGIVEDDDAEHGHPGGTLQGSHEGLHQHGQLLKHACTQGVQSEGNTHMVTCLIQGAVSTLRCLRASVLCSPHLRAVPHWNTLRPKPPRPCPAPAPSSRLGRTGSGRMRARTTAGACRTYVVATHCLAAALRQSADVAIERGALSGGVTAAVVGSGSGSLSAAAADIARA